jgi:TM2 domain-containing membrane protein YozV
MKLNSEVMFFKETIRDMTDKSQVLMLAQSKHKSDWWMSILITGLWQMVNGEAGKGICLFLFGWILLVFGGYIYGIINAHSQCSEFNNTIDMIATQRIRSIQEELKLKEAESESE